MSRRRPYLGWREVTDPEPISRKSLTWVPLSFVTWSPGPSLSQWQLDLAYRLTSFHPSFHSPGGGDQGSHDCEPAV